MSYASTIPCNDLQEALDESSPGLHHQHALIPNICFYWVKQNLYKLAHMLNLCRWWSHVSQQCERYVCANTFACRRLLIGLSQNECPWQANGIKCNQSFHLLFSIQKLPRVGLMKLTLPASFCTFPMFYLYLFHVRRKRFRVIHGSWLTINVQTGSCAVCSAQ